MEKVSFSSIFINELLIHYFFVFAAEYLVEANEENYNKEFQCANCGLFFNGKEFEGHVCDYDENQVYIPDELCRTPRDLETEVLRLVNHTGQMQRTFLREQCKITVTRPYKKPKSGPYHCELCDRKFNYESALHRHLDKHRAELSQSNPVDQMQTIVKCMKCGEVFAEIEYADKHFDEMHPIDENENTIQLDSNNYLRLIVSSLVYQCEYCDCVFTKLGDLFHHTSLHCPTEGYSCTRCNIHTKSIKDIQQHWQHECVFVEFEIKRKIKLAHFFACNVCEETFSRVDVLYSHRNATLHLFPRMNHATKAIQLGCEICGDVFPSSKDFLQHQIEHNTRKPAAQRKRNITSTKPRPHLCEICGKSYTQSSHLWQHLRFHQGIKPFKCPEQGCGRQFTIRPDLNDHIRKCHTGERPYHCLLCGKRFLTGSVFYQHRLIHLGERRHECEECGKKFYRADALKNHMRIHTGEKPYPCPHCTKAFRQRGDREKHIRARHKFLPPTNIASTSHEVLPPELGQKTRKPVQKTEKKPKRAPASNVKKEKNESAKDERAPLATIPQPPRFNLRYKNIKP